MTPLPAPQSHTFAGAFSQAQTKTHHLHTFVAPADAIAIDIHFSYGPLRVGQFNNKLTITLFDPHGFRGEAHRGGSQHTIHLDSRTATPGFIPGRLPPGEWTVRVNAQAALDSDPPLQYALRVNVRSGAAVAAPFVRSPVPDRVLAREAGWYRGELHAHTQHSDGSWTLAQMWERGRELGLDFIVVTDHNTIGALSEIAALPAERPLLIPGMEITSFRGHALAMGVEHWIDWRSERGVRTSEHWIDDVHAAGGLFAIAHPFTVGDPGCTGCSWEQPLPKPGPSERIEAIEICNEYWTAPANDNPMCLAFWRRLLTPSGGPAAIAGSDVHSNRGWRADSPWTWVHANELSRAGILAGIRGGRVVVSFGPWLELTALAQAAAPGAETTGIPGTHLNAGALTLRIAWRDVPRGAQLRLMRGKDIWRSDDVNGAGEVVIPVDVSEATWYNAEIWSDGGAPLALANPIYVAPPTPGV